MKAYSVIPNDYKEIQRINLQKDKKAAFQVNMGAAVIMIIVLLLGNLIVPFKILLDDPGSPASIFIRLGVLLLGYLLYMILHELTHATVMKAVGGGKVVFGFTGIYAFAGSNEDYFDKTSYRCIALAPLVVWSIIFGIAAFIVPEDWFWVIWFLQASNIGGSFGDIYVTFKLWNSPQSILIKDTGIEMTVYDRE